MKRRARRRRSAEVARVQHVGEDVAERVEKGPRRDRPGAGAHPPEHQRGEEDRQPLRVGDDQEVAEREKFAAPGLSVLSGRIVILTLATEKSLRPFLGTV